MKMRSYLDRASKARTPANLATTETTVLLSEKKATALSISEIGRNIFGVFLLVNHCVKRNKKRERLPRFRIGLGFVEKTTLPEGREGLA